VLGKQAQGLVDARWASVLDLPEEHAVFSAESPARVKKEAAPAWGGRLVEVRCAIR
jgi:hypothetical protein